MSKIRSANPIHPNFTGPAINHWELKWVQVKASNYKVKKWVVKVNNSKIKHPILSTAPAQGISRVGELKTSAMESSSSTPTLDSGSREELSSLIRVPPSAALNTLPETAGSLE